MTTEEKGTAKLIVGIAAAVIGTILLLAMWPFTIINANEKGLVFTAGKLEEKVLDEGFHWRTPIIQKIRKVTTNPLELQVDVAVGQDSAITKDNQSIGVNLTAFYRYDMVRVVEMYRNYGENNLKNNLTISIKESFKDVIGKYDIYKIAENQETIREDVRKNLVEKMKEYPIALVDFKISNYDWSDAFDHQIQATIQASQQVKTAEQALRLTEQEAQKLVKQAEAEKQAKVTAAEGDKAAAIAKAEGEKIAAELKAEAKAAEGEGIRKYNASIAANLEVQLQLKRLDIEMEKWSHWNGKEVSDQNFYPLPLNITK